MLIIILRVREIFKIISSCQESAVGVYVYNKLALLLGCSGKPDTESSDNRSKIPGQLGLPEIVLSSGIVDSIIFLNKNKIPKENATGTVLNYYLNVACQRTEIKCLNTPTCG